MKNPQQLPRSFFLDSNTIGQQRKEKCFLNKKYYPQGGDFFSKTRTGKPERSGGADFRMTARDNIFDSQSKTNQLPNTKNSFYHKS
ncbi:MAG: hypothetical protein WDM78_07760 [Puia sp.]